MSVRAHVWTATGILYHDDECDGDITMTVHTRADREREEICEVKCSKCDTARMMFTRSTVEVGGRHA